MLSWLMPALAALSFWGLWSFFPNLGKQYLNTRSFIIYNVLGSILATAFVFFKNKSAIQFHLKGSIYAVLTGLAGVIGTYFFVIALKNASQVNAKSGIIIILTALYPAIALLLNAVILKEHLDTRQIIGVCLALVAVVLIAK